MDYITKIGYLIVGVLGALYLITSSIGDTIRTEAAYKNPAKSMSKIVNTLNTMRQINTIQKKQIIEAHKQVDIDVKGNAKVETKQDGTQVITGDNIAIKSKEDKTSTATSAATAVKQAETKTSEKEKETSTPVFQADYNWNIGLGKALEAGTEFQLHAAHKLTKEIDIYTNINVQLLPFALQKVYIGAALWIKL